MKIRYRTLLLGGAGLLRLYVRDQADRAEASEAQRQNAEREQQESKRVNDANQAAILRLMNELQGVADPHTLDELEATEFLLDKLKQTKNNGEFFESMNT